jgi:malate dehydrogenase (quinone)
MTLNKYDVLIVGGGISGTALLYELARYTDLGAVGLVEKYDRLSQVNSHSKNNSQTIHCGDIETNYSLEKALNVKRAADMLVNYSKAQTNTDELIYKFPKMVLGVGKKECDKLRERFKIFSPHYDMMQLWEAEDIARVEPALMEGRTEEVVALGVEGDYTAVNYETLSHSFVDQAQKVQGKSIEVRLGESVRDIRKEGDLFRIETTKGMIEARFVVVSAGGHSLLFAQRMGYGLEFSCLPMGGSYYFTPQFLNGKVYTVQNDKLPFAAIHGDPDVGVPGKTRFGPTAVILPMLERYNLKTVPEFFKVLRLDGAVFKVFWDLFKVSDIRNYILKNFVFEMPYFNRRLFLKDVRKILPSLKLEDLTFAKGFGGLRPQLIDKKNKVLMLGEAKIDTGKGITFNMTPSPGGTSCLDNAYKDVKIIAQYLGCHFDEATFNQEMLGHSATEKSQHDAL